MRTIVNKILFGSVFIFLSWKGFDGLVINILHSSRNTVDILEIEQNKEFDSRNLEILNGIAGENFIYAESDNNSPVDIIYPLISSEQYKKLHNEPITIRVLVRINKKDRDCLTDGYCIPKDSTKIVGIVKFRNFLTDDYRIFESDMVKLSEDVILIEPDETPIAWYWNLLMFVGGSIFGFTILKSFFRRASGLKEYWNKVIEKET